MSITAEAVYEDGMLKFDHPLPLVEHQRVSVVIQPATTVARSCYGLIGWTGDPEIVRRLALDPEHGLPECP